MPPPQQISSPGSAPHPLQQRMFGLYRQYYHSGQIILLRQTDFEQGTLRIRKPGLYVLSENIVFQPVVDVTETEGGDTAPFAMGFFAAITVECNGVIIDLQQHSIRQSFAHYFEQRFFSVIELANTSFLPTQGPASVKTPADFPVVAAQDCMITNGTIGLTSHMSIHGNNNSNILLSQLVLQDFEVTGIQLNGVQNALLDSLTLRGIDVVPITSLTFALVQHKNILRDFVENQDGSGQTGSGEQAELADAITLLAGLDTIVECLQEPFNAADQAALADPTRTTGAALEQIWTDIQTCINNMTAQTIAGTNIPLDVQRFFNTAKFPDGSAMYGILINSSGVAVSSISEACSTNGSACAFARHGANYTENNTCRRSRNVTIRNVRIHHLQLMSAEFLAVELESKIQRDATGAIIDVCHFFPGSTLERARAFVGDIKKLWSSASIRALLVGEITLDAFIAQADATDAKLVFRFNADVMAHVSKGLLGLRIEDTVGLALNDVHVDDLNNTSLVNSSRHCLPHGAVAQSLLGPDYIDPGCTQNFAGTDTRALFLGKCDAVGVHAVTLTNLATTHGIVRAVDAEKVTHGTFHTITGNHLHGPGHVIVLYLHDTCRFVKVCEIRSQVIEPRSADTIAAEMQAILAAAPSDADALTAKIRQCIADNPQTICVEATSRIVEMRL